MTGKPPRTSQPQNENTHPTIRDKLRSRDRGRRYTRPQRVHSEKEARACDKMTLWWHIRKFCLECAGSSDAVRDCGGNELADGTNCNLFPYRNALNERRHGGITVGGHIPHERKAPTVRAAIRRNCVHCLGSIHYDDCASPRCYLYFFRHGGKKRHDT